MLTGIIALSLIVLLACFTAYSDYRRENQRPTYRLEYKKPERVIKDLSRPIRVIEAEEWYNVGDRGDV